MADLDSRTLVEQFEDCSLPASAWTHEAHLRVAFHYLHRFGLDESISRLRVGIRRYNGSLGKHDSYHETITVAMARLLFERMKSLSAPPSFDALRAANPDLLSWSPSPLHAYYSRQRLGSRRARDTYLEPDLAAFEVPDDATTPSGHRSGRSQGDGGVRMRVFLETPAGSVFRQRTATEIVDLLREKDPTLEVGSDSEDDHVLVIRPYQFDRVQHQVSCCRALSTGLRLISADRAGADRGTADLGSPPQWFEQERVVGHRRSP